MYVMLETRGSPGEYKDETVERALKPMITLLAAFYPLCHACGGRNVVLSFWGDSLAEIKLFLLSLDPGLLSLAEDLISSLCSSGDLGTGSALGNAKSINFLGLANIYRCNQRSIWFTKKSLTYFFSIEAGHCSRSLFFHPFQRGRKWKGWKLSHLPRICREQFQLDRLFQSVAQLPPSGPHFRWFS